MPSVGVFGVGDPGADAGADLGPLDAAVPPAGAKAPQTVAEAPHVVLRKAAEAARKQDEAEERRRLGGGKNLRLSGVEDEAAALEEALDAAAPCGEAVGVVVEEGEIVDVAEVAIRPQHLLAEVVEPVEVDVGEELLVRLPIGSPRRRSNGANRSSPGK